MPAPPRGPRPDRVTPGRAAVDQLAGTEPTPVSQATRGQAAENLVGSRPDVAARKHPLGHQTNHVSPAPASA